MSSFEKLTFYRGLVHPIEQDHPSIVVTRKNRKPRDSKYDTHSRADAWFEKKFGIKYRSQAVFVTSSLFTAQNYSRDGGMVVRVIPIDEYSYCWSPTYNDLLSFASSSSGFDIESYLEKGNYLDTDLEKAFESQHEVMLYCDRYIAIPINLISNNDDKPATAAKSLIII